MFHKILSCRKSEKGHRTSALFRTAPESIMLTYLIYLITRLEKMQYSLLLKINAPV